MHADYGASEGIKVYTSIGWKGGFSERLLKLVLKDISSLIYERM